MRIILRRPLCYYSAVSSPTVVCKHLCPPHRLLRLISYSLFVRKTKAAFKDNIEMPKNVMVSPLNQGILDSFPFFPQNIPE